MQRFWDERARENALYFVDTRLDYADPDAERFWAQAERDLEYMLELLEIDVRPSDVVADIGCGIGRLTRALSSRAGSVIGIDVSEEMLAQAREHNAQLTNVRWVHGDGTSLAPLQDASVDACISLVVFQHIPDPEVTLDYVREMGRVLTSGGWAAFQVSTDPDIHRLRRRSLGERVRTLLGRAPRGQNDPRWRGSIIDLEDVARAAADGGMGVERVENPGQQFCIVLARRKSG